ncbi:guanosine-3',5'-bis(diphosphate) 3'-pyrophosphohydrolase MESH1 [Condylostylus longicornis]|uniref:guanosine-3',5'-bis(diphosphate) 3'-pyrophosphohydrolase MESH1 n=1 Tax=Condylostylus longicornis TaxID=2530218 RepID=UPI00244E3358|nr:guanosine-3',5'-bis(diphosphate) 3'-pyrophosphohydrolase MESH1 [Condylostylus longicornis]XP_055381070.1 guanosine-3',5'-bis(diphosphate) 3'-pyrophosphohydrolase MESH1 [Condylostylus longicornis]XP_055381071.1 guanosine-3',5'-bis(diphosphate) 3'-pyrophosphohydrolase MESH1 [Condylostylus longicornis]
MDVLATLLNCIQFAAIKHKDQRRLDSTKTPYINHPIRVATILAVEGSINDPVVLMAAILHDTVEDTATTFVEIEENFGKEVCDIVKEVTDDKSLEKQERKRLQIVNAKKSTHKAKLVKLADKLDNLRDLKECLPEGWTEERRNQYFVWAKQVVDNLRGTNEYIEKFLDDIFYERGLQLMKSEF